jgi:hypothetical protein
MNNSDKYFSDEDSLFPITAPLYEYFANEVDEVEIQED